MTEPAATSAGPSVSATCQRGPDEIRRLTTCISDLLGVLGLRAIWSGSDPARIVSTLVDILVGTLHLDFAYARYDDSISGSPVTSLRIAPSRNQADSVEF